jgi:xanthine/uracil/vitamin C permease (AzgA family)
MLYRVKGAILIGIALVSIISWPRDTPVTAFPYSPTGEENFQFFKKVVSFTPLRHVGNAIDVRRFSPSCSCERSHSVSTSTAKVGSGMPS